MSAGTPTLVEREPTLVRYIEGLDEITSIRASWRLLEDRFVSLRGHKFLAIFDPVAGWYRACVVQSPESDAITPGLPTMVVPGGRYLRVRISGDPDAIYDQLPSAFCALESSTDVDPDRPRIEHYRRHTEVDVMVPVSAAGAARRKGSVV